MERLLEKVLPEPNSGCWLFVGAWNRDGYGSIGDYDRTLSAHRVVYEHARGPIPDGFELDHKCRVRCCVNPAHLEAVTKTENFFRGFSPPALEARKTHCKNDHPLIPENLYTPSGNRKRRCAECSRATSRRYHARKRAECEA
jgi:hypothetical protein